MSSLSTLDEFATDSLRERRPASERGRVIALLAPGLIIYAVAFVYPIVNLIISSFRDTPAPFEVGAFVGLDQYGRVFTDPGQADVLWRTVRIALLSTLGCLVLALPTALAMVRMRPLGRRLVLLGVVAPLLMSVIARTFGWWTILGPGLVGETLARWLSDRPNLLFTETAIVIGLVNVLLPYMVLTLLAALQGVGDDVRLAASSLGARRLSVMRTIDLPLSAAGLVSGSLIVFSLSISSFVTPSLLGGSRNEVLAQQVYRFGLIYYDRPLAAAAAVVLLVSASALVYANLRLLRRVNRYTTVAR